MPAKHRSATPEAPAYPVQHRCSQVQDWQTIECTTFHPQKAYLPQCVYGYLTEGHESRPGKHQRPPTPDNAGRTAAEATAHQQNKPSIQPATTPRNKTRTRRHSTPHQGGGHAQTRHASTGGGARTSTAPAPAGQKPQTTSIQQRRPYCGGNNGEPTKQAEHSAGYNTTNRNPNTPTQHAPPRGGPCTNTAPRTRGGHAPA